MSKKDIKKWIEMTEEVGYIDCSEDWAEEEYNLILDIAKELLRRMEEE